MGIILITDIKVCTRCSVAKPLDEYYVQNANKDKLSNACKICTKKRVAAYAKTEAGKVVQRRADAKWSKTDRGRASGRKVTAEARAKAPDKFRARAAVKLALKSGRLTKAPCENCGDKEVEAHHPDYSCRLGVTWLCRGCHIEEHKRLEDKS